jgi:hypothetical protein
MSRLPDADIKRHVENLLITSGHGVADIFRIYSPGDLGASDNESTTVLFSDPDGNPRTALIWREQKTKKVAREPGWTERVRVLTGWD